MIKRRLLIGTLIVVIAIGIYLFSFNMRPSNLEDITNIEYTTENFIDANELSDVNKLAASNSSFELYLDETTSHFKVVDKRTGMEWNSNPTVADPWQLDLTKTITQSALDKQQATLELSYFNDKGSLATINNYDMSISHPASVLYSSGLRTYSVKYTTEGFQILYDIKDVDIDYLYFPKFITEEVLETIPSRKILEAIAYAGYDEELGVYEITQYEDMSRLVRTRLYDVFYGEDGLGYTRERAIEENAFYGYTDTFEHISFQVAIDVALTSEGIKTSVIEESIEDGENSKLATVSLFPYFGTAISEIDGVETDGYLVVPDGTGAVIDFNNGKFYQQPYSKRLYGEDLGILDQKMPETQQGISIPLYGMVKEEGAFAAIITKGDTMATLNADVSGRIDSYNKVYPTFNFREVESITLGTGFNQYGLDLWTDDRVDTDFTVSYHFLQDTEASYVDIARVYREYLEREFDFDNIDTTNDTILTAELLGSYDKKAFFLGVPYYTNESLTTFEQSQTILDELKLEGVNNINVIYRGMMNGGLSSKINNSFNIERILGGKRDYNDLLKYADENNIEIYPHTRIMTASEYNKTFDHFRYTSKRIDGSLSILFSYHLPSKLPYSETPYGEFKDDYVINPLYLEEIMNDFSKDYTGSNLAFDMLGGSLGGSYGDDVVYKQDALRIQTNILSGLDEKLLLSSPLGYAIPYSDYITDLPLETTLYAIFDYQVPLMQLVLSGKIDYSTVSLNMSNERSVQHNFLKTIETGSNLKYTLSFDDSKELRETEFNYYISTEYTNWVDRISEQVEELDNLGIHYGYLVNHEQLAYNVFQVEYSNGLQFIINYNLSPIIIDGKTIPSSDYIVMEVQ